MDQMGIRKGPAAAEDHVIVYGSRDCMFIARAYWIISGSAEFFERSNSILTNPGSLWP